MQRLPWDWTLEEAKDAYAEYCCERTFLLSFRTWLSKHRLLELQCGFACAPYVNTKQLSEELGV